MHSEPRTTAASPPTEAFRPAGIDLPQDQVYCVFQRPWWLDAIAPDSWRMLEVVESGRVCARMPIVLRNRWGWKEIIKPALTQVQGPWLRPTTDDLATRLHAEQTWLHALIDQLPPYDYFCHNWHHSLTNWHPFHLRGFETSVNYTHVLEDLSDPDRIRAGYHQMVRRNIKKASNLVEVHTDADIDVLWRLNTLSFGRSGKKPAYSLEYLRRLDEACVAHDSRRLFTAVDAEGRPHAALYLVWDEHAAYYLIGGADPELRSSGAMSLLMHEAIRFAGTVSRSFDFEGSMVESIARFFRHFGGVPRPFFTIRGFSRRGHVAQGLKTMIGRGGH